MPFNLRDATPTDIAALAALHVETFRETHGGGPPMPVRAAQRHDGGVPGYQGELNKIYVVKRLHGHGCGRALVREVAKRFLSQGVTSMLLFGDARSPSNGFYERLGAVRLLPPDGDFHGGYGWPDLDKLIVTNARII
jgi:GNAT superfamily N-acetyltransferase